MEFKSDTDTITTRHYPTRSDTSSSQNAGDKPQLSSPNTKSSLVPHISPLRGNSFLEKINFASLFSHISGKRKGSYKFGLSKRDRALLLQVTLIVAVFITNLTILLYASLRYPAVNGVGLLYSGDCGTIQTANRWLHLLINVLSTAMLSSSSYCIQLQASPTRADVDKAHKRDKWVDIGAPSLRNLRYIGRWRLLSCVVLLLSSLPIHLVFNSAVFQSLASNDYSVAVVKDSFLTGASWNLSTAQRNGQGNVGWDEWKVTAPDEDYETIISGIQQDVMKGHYERKNLSDCYALYDDYWNLQQGNVVVLIKNETLRTSDDDTLLLYTFVAPRYDNYAKNLWAATNGTNDTVAFSPDPPVTTVYLGPPHFEASHCFVQPARPATDKCRLEYSTHILYTVVILNFIKLIAILSVFTSRRVASRRLKARSEEWDAGESENAQGSIAARKEVVLSTLGDAIESFMRDPDEATRGMCLLDKYDAVKQDRDIRPRQWRLSPKRWFSSVTWKQWFSLIFIYLLFLTGLYTSLGLLTASLKDRNFNLTLAFFRSLGFGSVSALTYLNIALPRGDPVGLISNVLIINSPQVLFSILYSISGAVLTTFLVQNEYSLMWKSDRRKTLRVSEPVGIQRSSYFISLPLRYGIPLNVSSAVFHWLISQSYFLARVTALLPNGQQDYGNSFSTLGYSPYPIIITGIIGFINLMAIVMMGFRRYDGTMSMVSTNSRAISAACHGLPEDREFGYQLPIQWGVIGSADYGVGHCAFTSAPPHTVGKPLEGALYW
ncbi:hypothetical protein F5Y18DRAFT_373760 [Xylariaceae sp. FL1019]|nr:hypothetical protein F5Y18DRAFT_373760 [Xylariaceae sp. FL1019]